MSAGVGVTAELGYHAEALHRAVSGRSAEGVDEIRRAAVELGHPGLLDLAIAAGYCVANDRDLNSLTETEYDNVVYGNAPGSEEKFEVLKNAIGIKRNPSGGEAEYTWHRGLPDGDSSHAVGCLYRELFWDDELDGVFHRALPEFSHGIGTTVGLAVMESRSLEDADKKIFEAYRRVLYDLAKKNLEMFEEAVKSGSRPKDEDYTYALKVLDLAGTVGIADDAKQAYSNITRAVLADNLKRGVFDPRLVYMADACGMKQLLRQEYAPVVAYLRQGGHQKIADVIESLTSPLP